MKKTPLILLTYILLLLIYTGINPYDRLTWILEIAPAVIRLIFLIILYPKFKFSNFTLILITIEMTILIIGGKYSYAKMPLFDYLKDIFNLKRNYYDRLGHFTQGFIPAMIVREVFIRKNIINGSRWLFYIIIFICLGISASYELIEFAAANIIGRAADSFLGTQGDVWDTQWDMTMALIGAIIAMLTLPNLQDKSIKKIKAL